MGHEKDGVWGHACLPTVAGAKGFDDCLLASTKPEVSWQPRGKPDHPWQPACLLLSPAMPQHAGDGGHTEYSVTATMSSKA